MTYIKIEDGSLDLIITAIEPIYQGENFSKSVTFLVPAELNGREMKSMLAYLIYIRADGHPDIVYLERDENMYNEDYYQYTISIPEVVTRYPGEVTFWIEFFTGLASNPVVLKTGASMIHILEHPTSADSLIDSQVSAIYQMSAKILDKEDDITPTQNDVILF